MSTPEFSKASDSLTEVRFYTEKDPYYYSVDNRPLVDLSQNIGLVSSAADSARSTSAVKDLLQSAMDVASVGYRDNIVGLDVSNPSTGVSSISPGVLFSIKNLSISDSTQILKRAALINSVAFNTPAPSVSNREIQYLVQVRHRDFDNTTNFPHYLNENEFSPQDMINGWLEVQVVSGAEASLNLSQPPTPTTGWIPVYTILSVFGSVSTQVSDYPNTIPRSSRIALLAASDAEVSIGVSTNSAVTPKSLKLGVRFSIGPTGYVSLPTWLGGFMFQWGQATSAGVTTVTFPIPFTTELYHVGVSAKVSGINLLDSPPAFEWGDNTLTSFRFLSKKITNVSYTGTVTYFAIGR